MVHAPAARHRHERSIRLPSHMYTHIGDRIIDQQRCQSMEVGSIAGPSAQAVQAHLMGLQHGSSTITF